MWRLTQLLMPKLGPAIIIIIVLVLISIPSSYTSPFCPRGLQFWNTSEQVCTNCTQCSTRQVVLRPCQPHVDTFCGPLSALLIDWSFVRPDKKTVTTTARSVMNKPRAKKIQRIVTVKTTRATTAVVSAVTTNQQSITVPVTSTDSTRVQEYESTEENEEEEEVDLPSDQPMETVPPRLPSSTPQLTSPMRPVVSAQPFSAGESFMWNWQVLTMVIAVTSCAIFMVVLAVYATIQARVVTGRRRQLERELDEVTAHLSLFTGGTSEQPGLIAEGLLPIASAAHGNDTETTGLYSANQCLYLEKLLERKQHNLQRGTRGNIYVETGRQATPAPARRVTRWKQSDKYSGVR